MDVRSLVGICVEIQEPGDFGRSVKRPGNDVLEVGPQPAFVGSDLGAVSDWIIAKYSQGGA